MRLASDNNEEDNAVSMLRKITMREIMRLASDNNEGDNAVSMLSKIKQASSHDRSEDTTWVICIYTVLCIIYAGDPCEW